MEVVGNHQQPPAMAKRMWHIIRAVYYMLYKGISKRKILAGIDPRPMISCRCADPAKSFYAPREVEFSCSNTPFYVARRHGKWRGHHSARALARAFEMLNSKNPDHVDNNHAGSLNSAAPSPTSPLPSTEADGEVFGREVDKEAEDFIRRFYQQLRTQQEPLLVRA